MIVDVTVTETGDAVAGSDEEQTVPIAAAGATQVTFTVSTDDDAVDEAASAVTATVAADSDTPATYTVGSDSSTTVSVTDNDERGVTVTVSPLTVVEEGTGTYTVVLTSAPTADVTITPASGDIGATTVSGPLTFTSSNWNTAQTVTVTGVADANTANETVTITHDVTGGDYGSVTVADVLVTVTDTTLPTVSISGPSSPVAEGTDLTFTLTLDEAASNDVIVDVTVTETGDAVAGSDEEQTVPIAAGATQVTFTVSTDDDAVDEAASAVTATVAADSDTPATYTVGSDSSTTVSVTDNDERGVTVTVSPLTVVEEGTGTYTVVLTSAPTADVTITPASGDIGAATVSGPLTFTSSNWNTAQTVTVTGVADANTANETVTITHDVTGGDYGSVTVADVLVTVTDTTLPTVSISGPSSPVAEGTDLTFTLTLDEAASNDVIVDVTVTETGDAVAGSDEEQTVPIAAGATQVTFTVSTDDDAVDEAASAVTATVAADSDTPATYTVGSDSSTTVSVTDNDERGVTVTVSPLTVVEEGTGTYTVVLTSRADGGCDDHAGKRRHRCDDRIGSADVHVFQLEYGSDGDGDGRGGCQYGE